MPAKDRSEEKKTYLPSRRVFTDREEPQSAFWDTYSKACSHPADYNVLHFYGRGGIGKSALLHLLHKQLLEKNGYCVFYDMEEGVEMRRILTRLRNMLRNQYPKEFSFELFDLTLLKFSELAGEHNELVEREDKTIIESNPILSALLEGMTVIPGVSIISTVVEKLTKGYHYVKDMSELHRTHLLKKATCIESLRMNELLSLMPEYFSEDLSKCCKELHKPVVFFFDTYERLVNYMSDTGVAGQEDKWLRDTIIQYTPNSVWTIAGRDRLRWREIDENWKDDSYYEDHLLGQLGKTDAVHYLKEAGIAQESLCESLFTLTEGDPLYLDICVNTWDNLLSKGKTPTFEDFGDHTQLVSRYLRYMDSAHRDMTELLACFGTWTDSEIKQKAPAITGSFSENIYQTIMGSTLVQTNSAGSCYLHRVVRDAILAQMPAQRVQELMNKIAKENAQEEALFSLDYVAVLDNDVDRLIEGLKKHAQVSSDAVMQKIQTLKHQSNYFELCRILEPLYRYQESVQFEDTDVYPILEQYLWALYYTDHPDMFLALTEKIYDAYAANHVEGTPWLQVRKTRINAYHNNRQYETAYDLAYDLKEELELLGEYGLDYTDVTGSMGTALTLLGRNKMAIQVLEIIRERELDELSKGLRTKWSLYNTLHFLGKNYIAIGEPQKALEAYSQALEISRETYGDNHLLTLHEMNSVALAYGALNQEDKKEEILTRVLDIYDKKYGYYDSEGLTVIHNLANTRLRQKRYQEALELNQKAYDARKKLLGENHPDVYDSLNGIALNLLNLGEKEKAKPLLEQALDGMHKAVGFNHPRSRYILCNLSPLYNSKDEYAKGEAVCLEGVTMCEHYPDMAAIVVKQKAQYLEWLGIYCYHQGKLKDAEQANRQLLNHLAQMEPQPHEKIAEIYEHLLNDLYYQERYLEALSINKEGLAYAERNLPPKNRWRVVLMEWVGYCLRKLNRYQEAYDADLACWEYERNLYGEDHQRTQKMKKNLDHDTWKLKNQ